MTNLHLSDLGSLLSEVWPVLLIGFATAGLAFVFGWSTRRRRRAVAAARPDDAAPEPEPHDPFTDGPPNDRRTALRRGGHPVTVHLTDPDESAPPRPGWVVNRSVGGLCLMVRQPAPIGSLWKVRPADAPRTTPPVLVEVRTCVAAGAEWKLNCRFDKSPSYGVLLMFG